MDKAGIEAEVVKRRMGYGDGSGGPDEILGGPSYRAT